MALRGIGFVANKFATEVFIDEIAYKRGIDPLAWRLELLKNAPRALAVRWWSSVAGMAKWDRKRDDRGLGLAYIDYSEQASLGWRGGLGGTRGHRANSRVQFLGDGSRNSGAA